MKTCYKCGKKEKKLNSRDECDDCERKRKRDEDNERRIDDDMTMITTILSSL